MKKLSIIIALTIAICIFASCNENEGSNLGEVLETETTTVTTTVTTNETTTETTTATTTETTETTTEPELESPWKQYFYVDEFNRETDNSYIVATFYGTFSNSATTNSKLGVNLIADQYSYNDDIQDALSIYLYEYDSHLVKNSYSKSKYYDIQVLEENDNIIKTSEPMLSGYDDIFVSESKDQNPIINALKNNNILVFRIDEEDSLDTYFFEVDCTGFKELFESTFGT